MLDAPVRRILATPLDSAAGSLQRLGLGANLVTVLGFVLGLVAAWFVASESYGIALLLLVLSRLADGLDGALARRRGETRLGGFLDTTLGAFALLVIAFAFATARQQNGLAAAFLVLGLALTLITDLAARAFARRAPHPADEQPFVLCEKSETFIIYVLMMLIPWAFALFAYAYGVLCFFSGGMRFATAVSSLSDTAKS
jgi:phosphatidylglycerophosphate synthase